MGVGCVPATMWIAERGDRSLASSQTRASVCGNFQSRAARDRAAREAAITLALPDARRIRSGVWLRPADGMTRSFMGGAAVSGLVTALARSFRRFDGCNGSQTGGGVSRAKAAELEHVARVATLGELTTSLTHELRQPLAAILTNSYVVGRLLEQAQAQSPGSPQHDGRDLRDHRARRRSHSRAARHAPARQHGGAPDQRRCEQ